MKPHFTPSPWKAKKIRGNHWVIEGDSPHLKGKWQTVCELNGPWDEKNYKANARLIAAAPELLAACQQALEALTPWNNHEEQEANIKLQIAIKLATQP
jgi:hypothetical protein